MKEWTFFTNYAHIYFLLALEENLTVREISLKVGITERSALTIIHELEKDKYIKREKLGRNNIYKIIGKKSLKHPLESKVKIKDIVELIKNANK